MTDPDTRVSARLSERLATEAGAHGVRLSVSAAGPIASALIREFISARAAEWSLDRLAPAICDPKPETLGFAEASLPAIAEAAINAGLPLDAPVTQWSREHMAHFLALAHGQIEEQAARTLERPQLGDDEIPF